MEGEIRERRRLKDSRDEFKEPKRYFLDNLGKFTWIRY